MVNHGAVWYWCDFHFCPSVHNVSMKDFQASLFGFIKPKAKVPLSKKRIEEIKEAIIKGETRSAVAKMQDLRESLEHFEQRIHNTKEE